MATQQRHNDLVIHRAFSRLIGQLDAVAEPAMRALLENAMVYALTAHDQRHFGHRVTRDSYGWLLLHNGTAVAHAVNEGRHGEGHAYRALLMESRDAGNVPQTGWVGILLASMEGETEHGGNLFYVVEYEQDILRETKDSIEENFNKYFKPIVR